MKNRKKLLAVLLAAAISLTGVTSTFAADALPQENVTVTPPEEEEPEMREGWNTIDGAKFFVKNGKIQKSWFNYKGAKYYLNPAKGGKMVTGLVRIKKNLYYFDKYGKMLKSRYGYKIGSKYYRASSKGVLKQLTKAEGLAGIQLDKLKGSTPAAFKWASKIRFKDTPKPAKGVNAAEYYGNIAFTRQQGDCTVQAYAFYLMAKVRGYNVKVVRGYIPTAVDANKNPTKFGAHTWCEIKDGSKTLVCDPNFAAYYPNGYKFTYNTPGHYKYYDTNKKLISKK